MDMSFRWSGRTMRSGLDLSLILFRWKQSSLPRDPFWACRRYSVDHLSRWISGFRSAGETGIPLCDRADWNYGPVDWAGRDIPARRNFPPITLALYPLLARWSVGDGGSTLVVFSFQISR